MSRRLRSGSRSARKGSRDRNGSKAWREIIRRALAGETVTFKSDFFDFQNIKVTPEPIQKPHPPIWLGRFTPAALRRAARFGDGFTVPGANRDVYDRYVSELKLKKI
jgi:alkanesulfonate monooxygenase SsuD/methylene tetrahydromethanopterin reductase-like flavin-dependent oxidoreductase (luciferase family)